MLTQQQNELLTRGSWHACRAVAPSEGSFACPKQMDWRSIDAFNPLALAAE